MFAPHDPSPFDPTPRHCDGHAGSRKGARPCDSTCPSRYRAAAGGRVDGRPVRTTPGQLALGPEPPVCAECARSGLNRDCPGQTDCKVAQAYGDGQICEGRR